MHKHTSRTCLFFVLLGTLACGGATPADTSEGQDVTATSSGIFAARGVESSGGTTVKLVNRSATKCSDGTARASCTIGRLDTSALNLSLQDEKSFAKAFAAGHALARGELSTESTSDVSVRPILKVTDAWIGAAGQSPI